MGREIRERKSMDIYLIRHADPDYELDTLTDIGKSEARLLGRYFLRNGITLDKVYVSTMGRAQETASIALSISQGDFIKEDCDWLRELDGCRIHKDGLVKLPQKDSGKHTGKRVWDVTPHDMNQYPKLESDINTMIAPVKEFLYNHFNKVMLQSGYKLIPGVLPLYKIEDKNNIGTIGFFCHGGVIKTLSSALLGWSTANLYGTSWHKPTAFTKFSTLEDSSTASLELKEFSTRPHLNTVTIEAIQNTCL
jgi:probable phosphoglycerate mutase